MWTKMELNLDLYTILKLKTSVDKKNWFKKGVFFMQ